MARPLRFQYAGASYHVMARGDGGKAVFEEDKDRFDFLDRLGKVCGSHGWRVHAWVLMGNHFHLLVETPEPNLVTGMKTLLGGFSQAWNRRRVWGRFSPNHILSSLPPDLTGDPRGGLNLFGSCLGPGLSDSRSR